MYRISIQGVTVAASIQTYEILIPGKCLWGPKSRVMLKRPWALTQKTTVYTLTIISSPAPFHARGEKGSSQMCTGPVSPRNAWYHVFLVCVNKKCKLINIPFGTRAIFEYDCARGQLLICILFVPTQTCDFIPCIWLVRTVGCTTLTLVNYVANWLHTYI